MHETLCHKIKCSSIGSSLFRMNKILFYVKCTGFTGNFSLTLSIQVIFKVFMGFKMPNSNQKYVGQFLKTVTFLF